jgi:hypothetical protein
MLQHNGTIYVFSRYRGGKIISLGKNINKKTASAASYSPH